ncbi:MAG TPA: NAD(P)/FAD-dependent oxidoreductase [Kofleriaceae bacterium]|nr:NAD(P)/FAD-dependent oxidoreductase [Kofleriaceae bacterium]
MERCEVLVVGGGLAGLACARGLAAAGCDTILLDQKRALGERVHTTGIFVRRTLEDFDLPDDCLGPPVRDVVLYSPDRRALRLSSPHDEFRVGRMAELYQHQRAAAEELGARAFTGHRFLAAERSAGGVDAEVEVAGPLAAGSPRRRRIRARFVIGADGARSRVAASLGLDRNRAFLIGAEDVLPSALRGEPPVMHCFLDPELAPGYLAWVVDDGHEAHVGVAGHPGRFRPLAALARFRASLAGLVPLAARPIERRGGRIPVGGLLARIADPRALLVGDAAGAVSPLTAGGLDPCLRQSRLAVQVVRAWLGAGQRDAIDAYQAPALRRRFRGRMLLRRGYSRIEARAGVELAFAALRAPFFSSVAARVFFGRGSFPDLDLARLLEEAGGGRGRLLAGARAWLTSRSSGPCSAPPATPAAGRSTR